LAFSDLVGFEFARPPMARHAPSFAAAACLALLDFAALGISVRAEYPDAADQRPALGAKLTGNQITAFAELALAGLDKEYPNKPQHVMTGPESKLSPRELLSTAKREALSFERFAERYAREMQRTEARQTIKLVAAMARKTAVAAGCFCENEKRCHRSILLKFIRDAARTT
jgi:uncharacterized protein YeaO (DUF488 family)